MRTCIEMSFGQPFYESKHRLSGVKFASPDYDEAFKECALDGAFSSAWTMQAAATVVQRNNVSVYPALNGVLDKSVGILNTTFQPRGKVNGCPIYILWSSTSFPKTGKTWTPNHIVPLLIDSAPVRTYQYSILRYSL